MIKNIIQSFLGLFNVRLARVSSHRIPAMPFDVFEHVLAKVVCEVGPSFRFIQVGTKDGMLNDSLSPLIRKYKMEGCLVEPMPDVLKRLKASYADQPQLIFSNSLISSEGNSGTIYRFKSNAPVSAEFYSGLARQDYSCIVKRAAEVGLSDYLEKIECDVRTLGSLYKELNYESLNLLYIYTAGSDDMVIYQAFDGGLRPTVINYEWTEMSIARNYELKMRLLDEGYRFVDVGADTICVRQ